MATLYITEYKDLPFEAGHLIPVATEPAEVDQTPVTFTTSSQSAAFNNQTTFVRILADADCHVLFGTNPTATANNQKLISNVEYWRGVPKGQSYKVAAYDGSS